MTVHELSREQLQELKQWHYMHHKFGKSIDVSWKEMAFIDNYVTDEEIFEQYNGTSLIDDDFGCTAEIPQF